MPALSPVVEKLEDVPEAARQFYTQREGKFHIELSGAPAGFVPSADLAAANGKVVEFRNNNTALLQEIEPLRALKTKVGDLNIDDARAAVTRVTELEKKGVKGADDVTKLVQDGVAAAIKPLQDQVLQLTTTNAESAKRASVLLFGNTIGQRFIKAGGLPEAQEFIVSKAQEFFQVDGDVVKAKPTQFSADRPGEPLTVDEWITRQTKEHGFAFKKSSGGGADPAAGGGGGGVIDGRRVIRNPTPQQLGQFAKDAKDGKVKFEYDTPANAQASQ